MAGKLWGCGGIAKCGVCLHVVSGSGSVYLADICDSEQGRQLTCVGLGETSYRLRLD